MRDVFWSGFADELEKLAVSEAWIGRMTHPMDPFEQHDSGFKRDLGGGAGPEAKALAQQRLGRSAA